jgi:hypothetical protein
MEPRDALDGGVTQKTTATNLTRVELGEIHLLKGARLPVFLKRLTSTASETISGPSPRRNSSFLRMRGSAA